MAVYQVRDSVERSSAGETGQHLWKNRFRIWLRREGPATRYGMELTPVTRRMVPVGGEPENGPDVALLLSPGACRVRLGQPGGANQMNPVVKQKSVTFHSHLCAKAFIV